MDKIPHFRMSVPWAIAALTASGLIMGTARWAIADGIPGVTLGTETGTSRPTPAPSAQPNPEAAIYTQSMLAGYDAAAQSQYQTALFYFERALEARPGDKYALAAIANMKAYLARRERIIELRNRVNEAVAIQDWACAAASVDELITFSAPNSLERARLVAYRGELSALMEAQADIENWSIICPG